MHASHGVPGNNEPVWLARFLQSACFKHETHTLWLMQLGRKLEKDCQPVWTSFGLAKIFARRKWERFFVDLLDPRRSMRSGFHFLFFFIFTFLMWIAQRFVSHSTHLTSLPFSFIFSPPWWLCTNTEEWWTTWSYCKLRLLPQWSLSLSWQDNDCRVHALDFERFLSELSELSLGYLFIFLFQSFPF